MTSRRPLLGWLSIACAITLVATGCSSDPGTIDAAQTPTASSQVAPAAVTSPASPSAEEGAAGVASPQPTSAAAAAPSSAAPTDEHNRTSPEVDEGSDDMPAPDYANDAGNHIEEYDYPDDPEPAESIVSTLCNLNQEYLGSLRATQGAAPVVDEDLRMNVLSLSDLLGYWDTLREHYPEAAPAIDTAQQIHDLWDEALLGTENGDDAAASTAMLEAERLLEDLPTVEVETCAH